MLVLQIVFGVAVVIGTFWAAYAFDFHSARKVNHSFLSLNTLIVLTLALGLFYGGRWWREHALQNQGDPLNGMIGIGVAGLIAVYIVVQNFRRAGILYGLIGTALQAAFAYFLGPLAVGIGVLIIIGVIIAPAKVFGGAGGGSDQVIVYRRPPNVVPPP